MHFFGDGDAFTQFLVSDPDFLSISSNGFPGFPLQMIYFLLSLLLYFIFFQVLLAPSGALVLIMVYYIPAAAAAPTFSNFSNSSDSKVKVKVKVKGPNMCYIFEKHGIQGYRI